MQTIICMGLSWKVQGASIMFRRGVWSSRQRVHTVKQLGLRLSRPIAWGQVEGGVGSGLLPHFRISSHPLPLSSHSNSPNTSLLRAGNRLWWWRRSNTSIIHTKLILSPSSFLISQKLYSIPNLNSKSKHKVQEH